MKKTYSAPQNTETKTRLRTSLLAGSFPENPGESFKIKPEEDAKPYDPTEELGARKRLYLN